MELLKRKKQCPLSSSPARPPPVRPVVLCAGRLLLITSGHAHMVKDSCGLQFRSLFKEDETWSLSLSTMASLNTEDKAPTETPLRSSPWWALLIAQGDCSLPGSGQPHQWLHSNAGPGMPGHNLPDGKHKGAYTPAKRNRASDESIQAGEGERNGDKTSWKSADCQLPLTLASK